MKLTVLGDDPEVVRLQCEGEISHTQLQIDHDPLTTLLGADCFSRRVLLGLERTTYIDSMGISWLLISHKRFNQSGGRLVLHTIPPMVQNILTLLKMHLIFQIAPNEGAARTLALANKS